MSDLEAEARRDALYWRRKYERLWEAVDEYRLWRPRKGHAAALRRLLAVWDDEEDED